MMTSYSLRTTAARGVAVAVDFLAERTKRLARKDSFDWKSEVLAYPERELQARIEITAFDVAHCLVVDVQGFCQSVAAEAALGPQNGNAVEECRPVPGIGRCIVAHEYIIALLQRFVKYIL